MGEETSDVSRALAAFGAPSIRYHSFGQGQARPPGLTLPRRVAQRPALTPVPAAPPPAPASLAPDVTPPIAEPALRLDEPVEQVRQEQPEAAPETLPVPQPEPQVTPAPVMAAPVMAAPAPPEVPAPEPSASSDRDRWTAPPGAWAASIFKPEAPAAPAPREAVGRRMHTMIAPKPHPEPPSAAAVPAPAIASGAPGRRLPELFAFLAGTPAVGQQRPKD